MVSPSPIGDRRKSLWGRGVGIRVRRLRNVQWFASPEPYLSNGTFSRREKGFFV
jgi:hypothetical protein